MRKRRNRDDADFNSKVAQEKLILDVTESVFEVLEAQGKSKADLAKAMGRSNAYITQLLNGSRNMTLRTLSDIGFALHVQPRIEIGTRSQRCLESTRYMTVQSNL